MKSPHARVRIDFAPGNSIGPGKVELLEAIAHSGSLSAAARTVRMSYRRAWLLLHSVNESFPEPAVRLSVGGRAGGGAALTEFGATLVAAYRDFESLVQLQAARSFAHLAAAVATAPKEAVPRRPLQRKLDPKTGTRRKRQA